jgi:cytochrome c
MSDLRLNTIFGTVLAAGLTVMGLQTLGHTVFHAEYPEKAAVAVELETGGGGGGEAAAVEKRPDFGRLFADPATLAGYIEAGDKVHKICVSCHTDAKGAGNKTGPELWGVFGRAAGTHAGFSYSAAMKAYGGTWSYDNLYDYLKKPGDYVKGTTMSFAGIRKQEDRIALVAYLRNINDNPNAALPAPLPEEVPAAPVDPAAVPTDGAAPAAPAEGAPAAPTPAPTPG